MKFNLIAGYFLLTCCITMSSCRIDNNKDKESIDNNSFFVDGKINADSGSVILYPFYVKDYFSSNIDEFRAEVIDGEFSVSGIINYPMAFTLEYEDIYMSELFVLEPGHQTMIIDIDENRKVPFVQNSIMAEYRESYLKAYEDIIKMTESYYLKWDSIMNVYERKVPDSIKYRLEQEIKTIYNKSDSILLNYSIKHPDSYLVLWKLINLFSMDGYNHTFNSTFEKLSPVLKESYPGSVLKKQLEISSILAIGNPFPEVTLLNFKFDSVKNIIPKDQQYTLIDFWYSSCRPCIDQFPEFSTLYKKYKNSGFEIVGISSDKEEDKSKWLKAIVKYELAWNQFIDVDAVWCKKMSINKFPTNYLLDSNGLIVAKDLRPSELKEFLEDKMYYN
ncbi:MAG: TlpA disulfide reductase family protein [Cyclobacteriaceae bacterium]